LPSRTLYVARDRAAAEDKRAAAEARVHEWSEQGELQLPRFEPDRISALRGTLTYPPKGSAVNATSAARDSERPVTEGKAAEAPGGFWHWRDRRWGKR
jgi:hypothetical protein